MRPTLTWFWTVTPAEVNLRVADALAADTNTSPLG